METHARPWFVAIGASGGAGLANIQSLLAALPAPLEAVVLVVFHRPWDTPSNLCAVLQRGCPHPVMIADDGEHFDVGTIYVGEPAQHLTLMSKSLGKIVDDPSRLYRNRTIDLLFRSVAEHGRERMIGVVLSGSLDDGSRGLAAIHHAGGITMVLVPESGGHRGMPENAIGYDGPIDTIGSPAEIAAAIRQALADVES